MKPDRVVFVVDDDPAVRNSLSWLIETVGLPVQTFASAAEFLAGYDGQTPGCVVLDVRMPGMNGLELLATLRSSGSSVPVIVVTAYGNIPMAVRAIKGGATEFLEKPVNDQVLLDHIQHAVAVDVENHKLRESHNELCRRAERLTAREREVMDLVVSGMSNREMADKLGISTKTVEAHRSRILAKMEARNVLHLLQMNLSLPKRA